MASFCVRVYHEDDVPNIVTVVLFTDAELGTMNVGVCRIDLELPESQSLKQKRNIIRSVIVKTRSRFNVAVAEIDLNDNHNVAKLGVVCLSKDSSHLDQIFSNVIQFIQESREDAVVGHIDIEIMSGF